MHFEPANKEKKRLSVKVPLILLIIWITGSTWYWMCGVKGMCSSSVLDDSSPVSVNK